MEYARFCPPYLPLYQIFLRLLTNEWGKGSNLDLIPNVFFLQKLNVYRTQYLLLSLIPTSFASVPKVCRIFARQMTNLFWPQKSSQDNMNNQLWRINSNLAKDFYCAQSHCWYIYDDNYYEELQHPAIIQVEQIELATQSFLSAWSLSLASQSKLSEKSECIKFHAKKLLRISQHNIALAKHGFSYWCL